MKKLLILFLILSLNSNSQVCTTAVVYDYIENYTWLSGWSVGPNVGYYTNVFVSSNSSAALIGSGNGTSVIESGTYILPNVTGLNASNTYYLEFRLGSYRISNPTATTSGNDVGDYVDVQFSSNNATYVSELRVTGNNNALWTYASTALASKIVSGTLTTFTPAGGGDRTGLGDGYSIIRLTLPAGTTQAAFRLACRVNSAGEEWWIDNIFLWEIGPCIPLPIELIYFSGINNEDHNLLNWSTASENNNNYFTIERSLDAINWEVVDFKPSVGNYYSEVHYDYKDYNYVRNKINYYRLSQTDKNEETKYFEIIAVESKMNKNECSNPEYYSVSGDEIKIEDVPAGIYLKKCGNKFFKIIKIN